MSFFHPLASIRASLKRIEDALGRPTRKEIEMSSQLDRLTTDVANVKTLAQSAVTLINGLADQVRNLGGDQAAEERLANDLEAATKPLSDALVANTPVAPSGLGAGPVPSATASGFASVSPTPSAPPAGPILGTSNPVDTPNPAAMGSTSTGE